MMTKADYIDMIVHDLRMIADDLEDATGRLETLPYVRANAAEIAEARDVLIAVLTVLTLMPIGGVTTSADRVH